MARPNIIIPSRFSSSAAALRYAAEVTSRNLAEAVFAAGGEPLMMHPHDGEVGSRLRLADGVLLPGGGDLAGWRTGQPEHPALYDVDDVQDAFDLVIAEHCLGRLPLLAVCRGFQVVNALLGGTVVQDMDPHHRHRRHVVRVEPGLLADLLGEKVEASCYHHQCVATLGAGLRTVATSEDGVVEGAELSTSPSWFVGVQWHPEDTWTTDLRLFEALVDAAH